MTLKEQEAEIIRRIELRKAGFGAMKPMEKDYAFRCNQRDVKELEDVREKIDVLGLKFI